MSSTHLTEAGERELELLPPIANFFAAIDKIAAEKPHALEHIGGNILIHVYETATRTIVSHGPLRGSHAKALDDVEVQFALLCEEWVLIDLLDPQPDTDLKSLFELGYLHMEGDFSIWERFIELAENKSAISVRTAKFESKKKK